MPPLHDDDTLFGMALAHAKRRYIIGMNYSDASSHHVLAPAGQQRWRSKALVSVITNCILVPPWPIDLLAHIFKPAELHSNLPAYLDLPHQTWHIPTSLIT